MYGHQMKIDYAPIWKCRYVWMLSVSSFFLVEFWNMEKSFVELVEFYLIFCEWFFCQTCSCSKHKQGLVMWVPLRDEQIRFYNRVSWSHMRYIQHCWWLLYRTPIFISFSILSPAVYTSHSFIHSFIRFVKLLNFIGRKAAPCLVLPLFTWLRRHIK